MGKDHKTSPAELDISWRTRELGPEMRRALFRKALPSVKFAARDDLPEAPRANGGTPGERPGADRAPRGGKRGSDEPETR